MPLNAGTIIGHYEVAGLLGAGGMGEVYRARDMKLKREVAIKVLPEHLSSDPDRVGRFQREAEVLAALNHSNIAHIYGLEEASQTRCIVMELVEGDTLADRLKRGPLTMDEVLRMGKEIAEALEAAHEKGILHRDLKPANIKITPQGKMKVLDFGLAKMCEARDDAANLSNSPTRMTASMPGIIIGTAAYMSPEQARGKEVDQATDLWAFGCVLYEMLTAQCVFNGETAGEVLAGVFKGEPDWNRLPSETPQPIRRLLRRCLQKEHKLRLRDAGDARLEIEDALNPPPGDAAPSVQFSRRKLVLHWFIAAAAGVALTATASFVIYRVSRDSGAREPVPIRRSAMTFPSGITVSGVAISPDGQDLIYVGTTDKPDTTVELRGPQNLLYHRKLDRFEAQPIAGTEGAAEPFFSPDGRWVGFFADGKIKKVPLSGGAPAIVCAATGLPTGATWTGDAIIFAPDIGTGLFQVSAAGGEPQPLTTPARDKGEIGHHGPFALPDGTGILFTLVSQEGLQVAALSRKTGQWRQLLPGGRAQYAPTGHLLFVKSGTLFALRFDATRRESTGAPIQLIDKVGNENLYGEPLGAYALSSEGTLAFIPRIVGNPRLAWVDRMGTTALLNNESSYEYAYPRLSPDGRRLAVGSEAQIWIYDLERGTRSRLTNGGLNFTPAWSPDGKRVAFASYVRGSVDILSRASDLSDAAVPVLTSEDRQYPAAFTAGAANLVFQEFTAKTGGDIRVLNMNSSNVSDVVATPADERRGVLSPDDRWIAYASNESGRFEVYVRPFGRSGGATTVSSDGGNDPVWSRDGRELFYVMGKGLMAVTIRTEPTLTLGIPHKLFEGKFQGNNIAGRDYDITPDGKRFIMSVPGVADRPMQINLVFNWLEELKHLAQ